MIYFDLTQTGSARHRSGLTRVTSRLREEAAGAFSPVVWKQWTRDVRSEDWFLSAELFSEEERPGLTDWLRRRPCRFAAVFHDAIPLRFPHTTWPKSVARHPGYMKRLAEFDHVFAVSETSRQDLLAFWRWQGVVPRARVSTIALGADGLKTPRSVSAGAKPSRMLLSVGILEPRKNQAFLLDLAERLWDRRVDFTLVLVGRINPHFGNPLKTRIRELQRRQPGRLLHLARADDRTLANLYGEARATIFATVAEGCGLPVLESLWQGVPCLCSDLPVLRENADGGGCRALPLDQPARWDEAVRQVLEDDDAWRALVLGGMARTLPTWAETARSLIAGCA